MTAVLDWLHMGGYGFYVWSSYGMLALALVIEVAGVRRRRKVAERTAAQYADEIRAERLSSR